MINRKNIAESKAFLANIGHFWPYILIPFTTNYLGKCTPGEISAKTGIPRRTVSRVLSELGKMNGSCVNG